MISFELTPSMWLFCEKLDIGDLGCTLNYQGTDNLNIRAGYSSNVFGDNDLNTNIIRLQLVYGWHRLMVNMKKLQGGQPLTGQDSVLLPLIKQLTEAALEVEADTHLAQEIAPNRRNGKSRKTMKSSSGSFELETPRDRAGTFEPQLIKKHQTHVSDEIETKILSMYGRGMSYRDIAGHVEELYGISVSTATLSAITDKIIAEVKEWQQRPLESHYPFVWMDAIH